MFEKVFNEFYFAAGKLYGAMDGENKEMLEAELKEQAVDLEEFRSVMRKVANMALRSKYGVPPEVPSDSRFYRSNCCDFKFIGMNHSPELNGMCRNCGGQWKGEKANRYLDEDGGRGI